MTTSRPQIIAKYQISTFKNQLDSRFDTRSLSFGISLLFVICYLLFKSGFCNRNSVLSIAMLLPFAFSCKPQPEAVDLPDEVSFNFDIRPILSNNCYVCHGPDSSTRKADFRLDLRQSATKRLTDGSKAINPGSWNKSVLISRVSSSDPEFMMPPPEMKRHLSAREIGLLKRWINQGAKWEPYWAFIAPDKSNVPVVSESQYVNNEIDQFINKKLAEHQLTPANKIDKPGMIRRLSFALTGLPPIPERVQAFSNDSRTESYEELVDYYLTSPRFGEQWARHWMDLVRYADTRGHEFDYPVVGAWQYRDYLIRAFNEDVPYDQLVKEHLAGDLLENPRQNKQQGFNESVIGTAFYGLTEGKHSPVDLRIDQSERIDNIIDVTSKTFQALTVACAKCHDHKFDPIPTTDYYSLYGMIESTRFTLTQTGFNRDKQQILDSLIADRSKIREYIISKISDDTRSTFTAKVGEQNLSPYRMVGDFRDGTLNDWTTDGIAFANALGHPIIKGSRIVGLEQGKASSKLSGKGLYGALRSPGFVIAEDSLLIRAAGKNSMVQVIIDNFQLIQDPIYGQLQTHPDTEDFQDYRINLSMWRGHNAYIELLVGDFMSGGEKKSHEYDLAAQAWIEVEYVLGFDSLNINVPGISKVNRQQSIAMAKQHWIDGVATPQEVMMLNNWFSKKKPLIPGLVDWQQDQQRRGRALYDSGFVVGVTDGDHIESPVFIRGSLQNLSKNKVPHRFFAALSDTAEVFNKEGSGRLELAEHIANSNNPLTARVMVNRLWHHVFGRGMVETVDNCGVQGKIPSHPELLDYLAVKFMEEHWSIKKILKYMVMSQAFQRVTEASRSSTLEDPMNIWLQHYPVRRINAESLRDAVLVTSGNLDTAMYGPSIPVYLTEFLSGRGRPKKSGPLDGAGRRSVYQAMNRNFLPPMMLAFDMPIPFSTFGRRNVSNVPSQSLTLLNDPFIADQASQWALQLIKEHDSFEDRIKHVYLQAFSRQPLVQEIERARGFFEEQQNLLESEVAVAKMEYELWKGYCHSIYNMKEFIFLI